MVRALGKVPLERALSKLGIASRSQTRQWVVEGRLKVNDRIVTDPAALVVPEQDRFALNGKILTSTANCTVLVYKPKEHVTTRSDEKGRKTVYDLLPPDLRHLHPVGRLDMQTTGLLLLTTDSALSAFLTDPANAIERVYAVTVKGRVGDEDIDKLTRGITDEGEGFKAQKVVIRKSSSRESHLTVTLVEGKNREIRRMCKAIGHEVTALKRIAFGPIALGDLQTGQYRHLTEQEVKALGTF
jgi:23S rRNA pseudouridine2605 synthase